MRPASVVPRKRPRVGLPGKRSPMGRKEKQMTKSQRRRMRRRRWKFGRGQTASEEGSEMAEAVAAGLGEHYVEGQRLLQMIEAETERRRARRRAGLGSGPWRTTDDGQIR